MPRFPLLLTCSLWLLFTLCMMSVLIRQDLHTLEQQQTAVLTQLQNQLHNRMQQSQSLLHHVSHMTVLPHSRLFSPALRAELEALRQLAPAVKRIQLQQRVRNNVIQTFEQAVRLHYPDFLLHGLNPLTRPATEPSGAPVFHPLVLVVPNSAEAQPPLLGTDLGLIPALQPALQATRSSPDVTFSAIYNQSRGEPLLSMFQASAHHPGLIASLVIAVDRLLDIQGLPVGTRLTLQLGNDTQPVTLTPPATENAWHYRSQVQHAHLNALPVQLTLDHPLRLQDFSYWPLLLALLLNTLGCLLLHAWIRQRQATRHCHQETLEIDQLKQHLQQHSGELQQQLQENQRLTLRILDIQERERRHLAQELHDELGQCLTAIRTDARMLLQDHPNRDDSVNHHAESIDAIACHIYDVTYDLMHALRPSLLDDLGLVDAVRELVRGLGLERQGIQTDLQLSGALNDMEERYNINLYRMIQEALTNLQRHAHCSQANIRLQRFDADDPTDRLELEISDNGCGFDPQAISRKGRFGVLGMQTRAKALDGSLQLDSAPEQGTRLLFRIPLAAATDTNMATRSATGSAAPPPSDADHRPASAVA